MYLSGNHEEAKEPIWQEHLDFLIVGGKVSLGVVALVRVGSTPLKTRWGQLVCCQWAGARGETEIFMLGYFFCNLKIESFHLQVMITVFSPSQALCSAMTWACVQMSWERKDFLFLIKDGISTTTWVQTSSCSICQKYYFWPISVISTWMAP